MGDEESDLEKIAAKMPAKIFEYLKSYGGGGFDMHFSCGVKGADYAETKNYKVLVAKWEAHNWSDRGGGIEWTGWLGVYFAKKEDDNIMEFTTKGIVTRDMQSASHDRRDLWSYNDAGIEVLKGNEVLVYWKDREGKKGPNYRLNLDEKIKNVEKK